MLGRVLPQLIVVIMAIGAPAVLAKETSVHVTGQGSIKVAPDQAEISFEVVEKGSSADALKPSVDEKVAKVISAAEQMDIESRDIQATGISVHPNYHYDRDTGEQRLVGVTVRRNIRVTVRDLERYPELIDAALKAGVNQAGQISLTLADPTEPREQALREAVDEAMATARVIADQLGLEIKQIKELRANTQHNGPYPMVAFAAARTESAGSSFREGEIAIEASVSMTVEMR